MYGNYIDEVIQIRDHTQPAPEDFYADQDDLFSVYAITDDTGVVTQRYLYGDYGTRVTTDPAGTAGFEPALEVDHGFTGRLHDQTSGLIEYRHRWMRPEMGRFVQRDPLWYVDGMNVYGYAVSSPLVNSDPFGLCVAPCTECALAVAGLGIAVVGCATTGPDGYALCVAGVAVTLGALGFALPDACYACIACATTVKPVPTGPHPDPGLGPSDPEGNCKSLADQALQVELDGCRYQYMNPGSNIPSDPFSFEVCVDEAQARHNCSTCKCEAISDGNRDCSFACRQSDRSDNSPCG